MKKIGWCDGCLQLEYIATKNFGEDGLTPRIKHIMIIIDNREK